MSKSDERNLNVTIKNEENDKDEVVISLSGIMRKLKKYFLPWVIVAVLVAVSLLGVTAVKSFTAKPPLTALVSFTYSGIEKGLDPAGSSFDANTLKSPEIIEGALTELDMGIEKVEKIRQNVKISGVIPSDAIDRLTTYSSLMNQVTNGSLSAAQALLETSYYPTQYKVEFSYGSTGLSKDDAVQVMNTMLDKYRDYFYKTYGYNKSLGAAVSTINYADYDYIEAVDLFRSTLNTLSKYLRDLSNSDKTHFRSVTGYTFDDLYQSVQTISSIDLDKITSYVTSNNLTNDKSASIAYYDYRIEDLNRQKDAITEELNAVKAATAEYQKDVLLVMQGTDGAGSQVTQGSEKYDSLVQQNVNLSAQLAETKRDIGFYTSRKSALEKAPAGSQELASKVEEQLAKLDTKVKDLVKLTQDTSDEYFKTVEFANAYNVLVPAVNSSTDTLMVIIKSSLKPIIIAELLLFVVYAAIAFINALKEENSKKSSKKKDDEDEDEDNDDDNNDDDNSDEKEDEKKSADKSSESSKQKPAQKNKNK